MRPIYKPVTLIGILGTKTLTARMDSNASWCYIRSEKASLIAPPAKIAVPLTLRLGQNAIQVNEVLVCDVELKEYRMLSSFFIVPELTEELIIGADVFIRWKVKIDPETEEIVIDPKALELRL